MFSLSTCLSHRCPVQPTNRPASRMHHSRCSRLVARGFTLPKHFQTPGHPRNTKGPTWQIPIQDSNWYIVAPIYIYICMLIYIQYIQLAQLAHLLMCSDQLAHLTWPTGDQLDRIQAHRVASRPPRRVRASAERAQSGWALMDLGI